MSFEVLIKHADQITAAENARIDVVSNLAYAIFGPVPDEFDDIVWSKTEYFVLGLLDEEIVSLIGLFPREIQAGAEKVFVAGLGGVATHPAFQRRGYAGLLLERSAAFMREQIHVPFGLLVCGSLREPYYARYGWQRIPGAMMFDSPTGKRTWTDLTMVLPLGDQKWPAGLVDLCGYPW